MSVIRKKPFIEYLIDDLTAEQKQSLLDAVNGSGNTVNASISNMPASAVTPVLFQFDANDSKTGILVQSTSYRVLICYHRFQDLLMFKFDAQNNYQKINEYLDINELRRLLEEVKDHIVASEIDSGEADAGLVLTADGEGGASWENLSNVFTEDNVDEGNAVKLFGFDVQGNLVQDEMPEGIVVDDSLDTSSENAVANKPVAEAIETIEADLETKANVDGNYPTMTVGVADQLSPYDDESGDDQDEPFSFQATGTGNGTQPDFSTGAIALMKEKQGNTVVVNQLAQGSSGDNNGITFTKNNDYTWTLSGTASAKASKLIFYDGNSIAGHKYLLFDNSSNSNVHLCANDDLNTNNSIQTGGTFNATLTIENGTDLTTPITITLFVVDLTQWFNGDIPQDLLDNPENFFRYYQGSLAYNTGELVNANGRYLKTIGRQQWDGEYTDNKVLDVGGSSDYTADGYFYTSYIRVIPNTTYYFKGGVGGGSGKFGVFFYDINKTPDGAEGYFANASDGTFTTGPNTHYIRCNGRKSVATPDQTCISLYYDGESGYDQYYPYEELTNNDTGTETLRSAGNVHDIKKPDGSIVRNVGVVDLGALNWNYDGNGIFYTVGLSTLAAANAEVVCGKYNKSSYSWQDQEDKTLVSATGGGTTYIVVKDSAYTDAATFKTAMSGVYLFYELAEPTTEQGTPYSENLVIDDFGSMDFSGTSGIPQGNLIFYPVDYKAFIDTLYNYTDGTPSNIALKSDLTGLVAQEDLSSGITDVAGLTYSTKKAYKLGNMVFLTISAQNTTGSDISSGTTLFTLSSGLFNTGESLNPIVSCAGQSSIANIGANGNVSIYATLSNNQYVVFCVCYAVA